MPRVQAREVRAARQGTPGLRVQRPLRGSRGRRAGRHSRLRQALGGPRGREQVLRGCDGARRGGASGQVQGDGEGGERRPVHRQDAGPKQAVGDADPAGDQAGPAQGRLQARQREGIRGDRRRVHRGVHGRASADHRGFLRQHQGHHPGGHVHRGEASQRAGRDCVGVRMRKLRGRRLGST